MGFALPNGATVFVGSKMVAALPATAVSNAKGAVFTVTGGTLAANDIVLIKSGWGLIDNLVAKVTTAVALTDIRVMEATALSVIHKK
jgi:hypothetical protein